MTYISRDPFARTELHRQTIIRKSGCDWCGQKRQRRGKELDALFVYSTEHDSGRIQEHIGAFCSLACHNAYHDR